MRKPLRNGCSGLAITIVGWTVLLPSSADSAPANTLSELFTELNDCLEGVTLAPGSQLTVIFALRRDGKLLGKPRITFARLQGDAEVRRELAASIAAAFGKCLPLSITDSLGGAIAGRPLTVRFVPGSRDLGGV
jgi:hypothetical protein